MSNLTTNHDILADALFMCGEIGDITSSLNSSDYYNQAIVLLNRAHHAICSGGNELDPKINEDWWFLRKSTPGIVTLLPAVNAGTCAFTKNSLNITFSTTPQMFLANVSVAGYYIIPATGNGDVYKIATHTVGATIATLDSVFTDTTQTAGAYKAVKVIYDLATDFGAFIGQPRVFQQGDTQVNGVELEKLLEDFPMSVIQPGVPQLVAMVGEQTAQFSHYAGDNSEMIRVEYDYKVVPTDLADDTNTPLIPRMYRRIMSDYIQGYIGTAKSDDRNATALASCKAGLQAMSKEHRARMNKMGNNFGKIQPRTSATAREGRILRTSSGMIIG